ncbi:hypothetical protein [Francisella sp. 19X1-34]|uniref:hypothetical protein n=1 Tax=Francisella sp. 19X1-34 TaxID=3087177 RepID=UPI002E31F178|nr:hypothetical protein [Francisella sp. 19X1-34]MED7789388.1 hypothetical protein [Francisella sp. 19X1-34]
MVDNLRKILNPLISNIEKTKDIKLKKDIARKILTKIYQTKDKWLDKAFFEKEINYGCFYTLRIYLNPNDEYCITIQGWGAHHKTPIHNHDTWSSSITILGSETQYLHGKINKPYPKKYAPNDTTKRIFKEGDRIELASTQLHQVENHTDNIALSAVFFMKHPNTTNRISVCERSYSVKPWKVVPNKLKIDTKRLD